MLTEDLDIFLDDFGIDVEAGAITGLGILDMPDRPVLDEDVLSTSYAVTCRSDQFGFLRYGDLMTIDGTVYRVQENHLITDGKFCKIELEQVAEADPVTVILDGDFITGDGGGAPVEEELITVLDGDFI